MADGDTFARRPAPERAPANDPGPDAAPLAEAVNRTRRVPFLRLTLLTLGPLLVALGALHAYLAGGRHVTTDNAYLRADKIAISTDVAGTVAEIAVRNDQPVDAGALLFRLDDEPYRIALDGALAQQASVRNELAALQAGYDEKLADIRQVEVDIAYFESVLARSSALAQLNAGTRTNVDDARYRLDAARQRRGALQQQARAVLAQLGGRRDQPVELQARYRQAQAQVERAERDLRRTAVTAPAAGIVTAVDKLQIGQYLAAAQPAFGLVSTDRIWVEANPKETDLTHVKPGDPATVRFDTYPDVVWSARVASLSPATGAEFAVLPAQNASGNWVKVVQRIPVRIELDARADGPPLRAGMSADVSIDTGRERTLDGLIEALRRRIGL